jgi:signal-transduction protein with cAMP-binding, CBS, and nucleotidyltransferase domain
MAQQINEKETIVKFLSKVPPFSALNKERLGHVAGITTMEKYSAQHKLFAYGDKGDKLYIIMEGG